MKKYIYYVNKQVVQRKDFVKQLQDCCSQVVDTTMVRCIGVDFAEFDKKKFNRCMRGINQGVKVIFMNEKKEFDRKEMK